MVSLWVVFSLLSTLSDVCVTYIDEWLIKKLKDSSFDESLVDAPGRLVLISGAFGIVVSALCVLLSVASSAEILNISYSSPGLLTAVFAGVLEVVWLIPYFYALQKGGAINATPLFQLVPICSLIIGILFFSEVPLLWHVFAAFLIVAGATLLNYSTEAKKVDLQTTSLMLAASAAISLGYFVFKDAAETSNLLTSFFGNGIGMAVLTLVIFVCWKPYRQQFISFVSDLNGQVLWLQFLNESIYAFSAVTARLAVVLAPAVVLVNALEAFHPVFTIIIGGLLAHFGSVEHKKTLAAGNLWRKAVGVLLIAAGTAAIAL